MSVLYHNRIQANQRGAGALLTRVVSEDTCDQILGLGRDSGFGWDLIVILLDLFVDLRHIVGLERRLAY